MEIDPALAAGLISIALSGAAVAVVRYRAAKKCLKETVDTLNAISVALEDDQVTEEELRTIVAEGTELAASVKAVFNL